MKNFLRRVGLVISAIVVFKDWDLWLAARFGHHPNGVGIFRMRNGVNFSINYSTTLIGVFSEIWLTDYYERWYAIQKGDIVIDIGAHIGVFTALAGSKGATVYAYEPTPESYEFLKKNTEKYDVHPFQLAVADAPGNVTLSEVAGRGSSGNSIFALDAPAKMIMVRATTLAEIFADNHLAKCDLLKMDCEGAETKILKDVPREVFAKIKNIAMEYHSNFSEVKQLLESNGYRILETKGDDLGYLWATNE